MLVFCVSNNVMPGFGLFNHIVFMWLKSVYGVASPLDSLF